MNPFTRGNLRNMNRHDQILSSELNFGEVHFEVFTVTLHTNIVQKYFVTKGKGVGFVVRGSGLEFINLYEILT